MGSIVSTITSKWQVTIPEDIRKEIALKIGQRIVWEVDGERLVARRVRSLSELAGCLKPTSVPVNTVESSSEFAKAAMGRHDRISKQKS